MSKPKEKKLKAAQEPLIRMVKRASISQRQAFITRAVALVGALLMGALLLLVLGKNPIQAYGDMVKGALGSNTLMQQTIKIAIPLLVTGIAIAFAFKMKFWNIGGEGQILAGAVAASYFALFMHDAMPKVVLLLVMAAAAVIAGGIYGTIPALFKSLWGTNETLFTLMLNYIAIRFVSFLEDGPWKEWGSSFPKIAMFNSNAMLPKLFGVHIGWVIALLLVAVSYIYLTRTKQGYEISVVGESNNTARYAGMNVSKVFIRTMFISGAIAGLVGFLQVAGANGTLNKGTAGGAGFTAITVAWLSKLNPIVMIAVAFLIAVLQRGANAIQTTLKIPASASEVLTGIILFFMLGCEFFINYKLIFRGGKGSEN